MLVIQGMLKQQCHYNFFFDQPVKGDMGKYENIPKVATGQEDDYTAA